MKYLRFFLILLAILLIHIFVLNFLPYPFGQLNVVVVSLLWLIILRPAYPIFPLGFALAFFIEIFSGLTFGIYLTAFFLTLLLVSWTTRTVLSNRSFFTVMLSIFIGLIGYRLAFLLSAGVFFLFSKQTLAVDYSMLLDAGWELALGIIASAIIYAIAYNASSALNPAYIKLWRR